MTCVSFPVSIYFNKKLKYKRQNPSAHEVYNLVKTDNKQVNTECFPSASAIQGGESFVLFLIQKPSSHLNYFVIFFGSSALSYLSWRAKPKHEICTDILGFGTKNIKSIFFYLIILN